MNGSCGCWPQVESATLKRYDKIGRLMIGPPQRAKGRLFPPSVGTACVAAQGRRRGGLQIIAPVKSGLHLSQLFWQKAQAISLIVVDEQQGIVAAQFDRNR